MKYKSYLRNHVVLPGSEKSLHTFLNAILVHSDGTEEKHKLKHARNSNSEDALTWSCFDLLRHQSNEKMVKALNEIIEDAFEGKINLAFENENNLQVHIGDSAQCDHSFPLQCEHLIPRETDHRFPQQTDHQI